MKWLCHNIVDWKRDNLGLACDYPAVAAFDHFKVTKKLPLCFLYILWWSTTFSINSPFCDGAQLLVLTRPFVKFIRVNSDLVHGTHKISGPPPSLRHIWSIILPRPLAARITTVVSTVQPYSHNFGIYSCTWSFNFFPRSNSQPFFFIGRVVTKTSYFF